MVYKLLSPLNYEHQLNSLIIFEHELEQNSKNAVVRCKKRLSHLREIIKVEVGQSLKVTIPNRGLTNAIVKSSAADAIEFEINSEIHSPSTASWHLLVGLSRPPTMKKILEHATTLGIKHFHFVTATLSEKSYQTSKIWEEDNLTQILSDGLAQSAHYWEIPTITLYSSLKKLPDFSAMDCRLLSLHTQSQPMRKIEKSKELILALGPERGWTKDEDELLQNIGFQAVSLGSSVLRVEIATFAVLGQCHLLLE